ncbi:transglutaminase-like cysteine peptidase [Rhizobium sp. L80/93]|uniref:transglutaminase-like cysteine peptidase n=1 Tax=Rhizobium sp. E27B/91 TaxID=2819995 RepID=UPI001ADD1BDA|nr:transglutaminase-like cysteine peptidase [Rhizobium sp. E27B/91]
MKSVRLLFLLMLLLEGCATETAGLPPPKPLGHAFLVERGRTLAPFAHVAFCMKAPFECKNNGGSSVVTMTASNTATLESVNNAVNSAIVPREDPARVGTWQVNPFAGDCNDYAVSKRSELIQAGMPARALRLAVAKTPSGIGHTVLVVRTTLGDVVLDNRNYQLKRWDRTDLTWLKIESGANPQLWYNL